jgi:type I restriction enzyme, R subunit
VQTLSRLNRIYPRKDETMVLDFANEVDDIRKAFEPYYDRTSLREGTDPNLLYDLQRQLEGFHFYDSPEVDRFAEIYFNPKGTQDRLHAVLVPVVDRYVGARPDEQEDFRGALTNYVRLYAFLSQVITFVDADLEKLYVFGRLLLRKLPVQRDRLPLEVQQNIDIDSYRVQQTHTGKIALQRGAGEIPPIGPEGSRLSVDEQEMLSKIIQELNKRFGTDFTDEDRLTIQRLEQRITASPAVENSLRVNTRQNARMTFDLVAQEELQDIIDSNFKLYKQVTDNKEFARVFFDWMFDRCLTTYRAGGEQGGSQAAP